MRKKFVLVLVIALVLITVLTVLCACESYKASAIKPSGDKNAAVESNGGLVVKQGGYLYFVNGYTGYLKDKGKDNWFGNVKKGAIVRVSYAADGTLGNDYVVVVPKSIMADSENVGFSIFGNYIYYVSPSAEEDRSGNVQTDTIQFMRTKLDGTGTQVILNVKDTSVKYSYTPSALVWYDSENSKLYSKSLNVKKFKKKDKGKLIDDEISSVYFTKCDSYDPANKGKNANEFVFYTKASKDSFEYGNSLYVVHASGSDKKVVIGPESYQGGKYAVSVVASSVTNNKLAIYYTKTSFVGTSSTGTVLGTFAYEFQDTSFTFGEGAEVKLSSESLSSLYPLSYAEGIVAAGSGKAVIYYTNGADPKTFGDLTLNTLVAVAEGKFYYVNGDNYLCYYAMDNTENAHYALDAKDKVMTSFTGAEYFGGYLYFIKDDDYDYVYRVKLAGVTVYDASAYSYERIGIVTASDQAKMDEEAENSESSDK